MTPPPFTDLHSHLVPGVDDGSASVEESLDSLAALRAEGVAPSSPPPICCCPGWPRMRPSAASSDSAPPRPSTQLAEAVLRPRPTCRRSDWARRSGRPTPARSGGSCAAPTWARPGSVTCWSSSASISRGPTRTWCARSWMPAAASWSPTPSATGTCPAIDPLDQMRRWRELGALLQVNAGSFNGHYRNQNPAAEDAGVGDGGARAGGPGLDRPPRHPPGRACHCWKRSRPWPTVASGSSPNRSWPGPRVRSRGPT